MAVVSLIFLLLLTLVGISTLIIDAVTDERIYNTLVINQDLTQRFVPPNSEHILGLDEFGRDILLRIIWGTRYSLFMSVAAIMAAGFIGTMIGAAAGYYGGKVDNVIMRCMDIILSLPYMLLAIAIVAALGPGLVNVLISIAIGYVPEFARITRASVMTIREREFIEAARAVGANLSEKDCQKKRKSWIKIDSPLCLLSFRRWYKCFLASAHIISHPFF